MIVSFGAWGEAKAHLNPDLPGRITSFTDERRIEYVWMREVGFTLYGSVETRMTPLTPRKSGDPWPRKFSFAFQLKDGETVYFTGVPAPPLPYVSVREIPDYSFTNGKPAAYLEAKRREMRAAHRAQKGGERP